MGTRAAARPTSARPMRGTAIQMRTARALSCVDRITAQALETSTNQMIAANQVCTPCLEPSEKLSGNLSNDWEGKFIFFVFFL